MMDSISARLSNMSGREKVLTTLSVLTLLTYFSYMLTFQPLLMEIGMAEKHLAEYDQTRRNIENARGSLTELGKELNRLKADLAVKKELKARLDNRLSSGGHTDNVLKSLENSARKMDLELLELRETASTAKKTNTLDIDKSANMHFTKNALRLKYRSSYPAAVEYLASMAKMPYALSILSVEMTPSNHTTGNPLLVTTTIEMELFSK